MSILIHRPCNTIYPFLPSASANCTLLASISLPAKLPNPYPKSCKTLCRLKKFRRTGIPFCTQNGVFEDASLPKGTAREEPEALELRDKPYPKQVENGASIETGETEQKKVDADKVLEPFYRFFKEENELQGGDEGPSVKEENENVVVEYYDPKAGDLVVGVVVSGNENKLDVNVGADMLGTMLTKEVLPLYDKEMDFLLCDMDKGAEEFLVRGKVGIVRNDEALYGKPLSVKPVVEPGTVLFAEVLGRTLGGRPLLSSRRLFRRLAWHRVRQIKQLNEPIEVKITEWNTGGLLTRVEGLRGFLPKAELLNRANNFTELKENVGRRIHVLISRINEDTNDLILSEKEAWGKMHLQEGTLLEGTVKKIFSYGAQIRIGDTNRSGLLHISSISKKRIASVSDILAVEEVIKVLVVKSKFPEKISLSIAELESVPGLFLSDKEKVISEAEVMAKMYRQKNLPVEAERKMDGPPIEGMSFNDEEKLYSNWKWFEFERDNV